jgi:signal transduction histidine kinase
VTRRRLSLLPLDLVAAAALSAAALLEVVQGGVGGRVLVAAPTQVVVAAAVGLRGRAPLLGSAIALTAMTVDAAFAGEPGSATAAISLAVLFFACGADDRPRRRSGALVVIALFAVPMFAGGNGLADVLAAVLTSMGVPWLVGGLRRRQLLTRAERARAEQLVREREEATERAVAAERARLARELHDVVSHNVGMIIMQAGAGEVLLDDHPERTRAALQAIEEGARSSLVELRRMLGLLRESDPESLGPAPGLALVPELARRLQQVGVDVAVDADVDDLAGLPAELDLAAFRIVQEALTNVVKHSDARRAAVRLRRTLAELSVTITDDGHASSGGMSGGYGLTWLRERAVAVGGSLTAGPTGRRGWEVRASLPCPRQA